MERPVMAGAKRSFRKFALSANCGSAERTGNYQTRNRDFGTMVAAKSYGLRQPRIQMPIGLDPRQLTEAFGWEEVPRYIVRDCAYGDIVVPRLQAKGIRTAPRSPWQKGYCERLIGSIRRDYLDHVVVFGELHLRHIPRSYAKWIGSLDHQYVRI
jgi:hypothetical protein